MVQTIARVNQKPPFNLLYFQVLFCVLSSSYHQQVQTSQEFHWIIGFITYIKCIMQRNFDMTRFMKVIDHLCLLKKSTSSKKLKQELTWQWRRYFSLARLCFQLLFVRSRKVSILHLNEPRISLFSWKLQQYKAHAWRQKRTNSVCLLFLLPSKSHGNTC